MSINREATALRNESPDRELYGFRDGTLFAPLDLVFYEVDSVGRPRQIVPPPSNVEFRRARIMSGSANLADITSYDVPPIITNPFIKADILPGARFANSFDLDKYSTPTTVSEDTPVCLYGGRSGRVTSSGLVSRLYAGTTSSLMVYEVDLGILPNSEAFHGSQVFIGSTVLMSGDSIANELLGMLITTSLGSGSSSLVFPANQIV